MSFFVLSGNGMGQKHRESKPWVRIARADPAVITEGVWGLAWKHGLWL